MACAPSKARGPAPVSVGKSMLLVPMTNIPPGSKLTGVPEIVTPGPPADIVVPSMENAVGFAVKTCPSTVSISAGVIIAVANDSVLVPITTSLPLPSYDIGVPEAMMTPPGVSVCPSMMKSDDASAVYVEPSNVSTGAAVTMAALPRDCVLLPMTAIAPPDGKEIGVPETVIAAPCANVCPSIMKSDDASAVYDEPSNESTAGAGVIAGALLRD